MRHEVQLNPSPRHFVAIHAVPRSGTTWLGEILNSSPQTIYKYQPLFSYRFKHWLTQSSKAEEIVKFFELMARTPDPFLDQEAARLERRLPVFDKAEPSHVVYKEVRYHHLLPTLARANVEGLKLILLIRNPFSVINSWLRAPREFRKDLGWKAEEEWRYAIKKNLNRPEEFNGYERWKEATQLFLALHDQYPECVMLMKYANLVATPVQCARELFDWLGLKLGNQSLKFLEGKQAGVVNDAYSVFRTNPKDDAWRDQLPDSIAMEILNDLEDSGLRSIFSESFI